MNETSPFDKQLSRWQRSGQLRERTHGIVEKTGRDGRPHNYGPEEHSPDVLFKRSFQLIDELQQATRRIELPDAASVTEADFRAADEVLDRIEREITFMEGEVTNFYKRQQELRHAHVANLDLPNDLKQAFAKGELNEAAPVWGGGEPIYGAVTIWDVNAAADTAIAAERIGKDPIF